MIAGPRSERGRRSPTRSGVEAAPRLLLVAAHRWLWTAQLALAARDAGFDVALLAPADHPVAELPWVRHIGRYSALLPSRSVVKTLNAHRVRLVLPVDDLAAVAVFAAHADPALDPCAAKLLAESLGDPTTFACRHDRAAVAAMAARLSIRCPPTRVVHDEAELGGLLTDTGLPAVLKTDGSFGGQGVVVAENEDAAVTAYRRLSRSPRLLSSAGRLIRDDEANYLRPSLLRSRPRVTVQPFVPGTPATITAASWRGEMLGHIAVRALVVRDNNGPATVVEPIHQPEMTEAARTFARVLGLSGLYGLDFLIGNDGFATLLELNPRATPTAHLRRCSPHPLLELLAGAVGVELPHHDATTPISGPIALFPQEQLRDANSPYLQTADHDRPGDSNDVTALCKRWADSPIPSLSARARRLMALFPASASIGSARRT